jgi:membrane-bound lytic murein transglycosylase B
MFKKIRKYSFAIAFALVATCHGASAEESFHDWLTHFRQEALRDGVSQQTIDKALPDFQPIQRVIDLDRKQPELKWTFEQYRKQVVNKTRVKHGREMMKKHAKLLNAMSKKYGVPPQYIVALWGIETNYGQSFGNFETVKALATLAWEGRRADFFKGELIKALRIIDEGHIGVHEMKGSWAGAMGHNQFMPSSFLKFAQDGDGDGKKDIWHDLADVFASTANYLSASGWHADERWGRAVKLPKHFDQGHIGLGSSKTLEEWKKLGVKLPNGGVLPVAPGIRASLVAPDGLSGPAYLVYDNYKVIMKWNRSTFFATSVGLLADAIAAPSP